MPVQLSLDLSSYILYHCPTRTATKEWRHAASHKSLKREIKTTLRNTELYVSLRGIIRRVALAEHIVVSQMYDHLDLHHVFTDAQQSIVVSGVVDVQRLNSLLITKKNVQTDAIYLDFSKAFDKVPPEVKEYSLVRFLI